MIIGYTAGVYDMFHIGHLNVIKNAKANCDCLIVCVTTDEAVERNKNKTPIISYAERAAIVEAIKYVDKVIPQERYDIEGKEETVVNNHIDVMFVGSDWEGTEKWEKIEENLQKLVVKFSTFHIRMGFRVQNLLNILRTILVGGVYRPIYFPIPQHLFEEVCVA